MKNIIQIWFNEIKNTKIFKRGEKMRNTILKLCCFLSIILIILSACCAPSPPPVSKAQIDEAKTAALNAEKQVAEQDAKIKALEEELKQKEAKLAELKAYEQQLKDEGFLGEE